MFRYKIAFTIFFLFAITWGIPCIISPEIISSNSQQPTWKSFFIFGTYYNENLLYVVLNSAKISLLISMQSLLISIFLCLLILIIEFYVQSSALKKILQLTVYFPRLFVIIFFCAVLKLHQPSQLSIPPSSYLIITLGISGSFFLLAQTYAEIQTHKNALFVHFALSLPIYKYKIFIRHILANSITFPINIAKQMRDNIMFISILPFTGVIHLQPEDLGGLINKYFSQPATFNQGWWILFFPCAYLVFLILIFDIISHQLGFNKFPKTTQSS